MAVENNAIRADFPKKKVLGIHLNFGMNNYGEQFDEIKLMKKKLLIYDSLVSIDKVSSRFH